MPHDWEGNHPFDSSCVENDMVAKAFGWAWDLRQDRVKAFWKELLSPFVDQIDAKWEHVKLKFSAYPGHHGTAHHGEIADIVLLGPDLYVAIEAKRPNSGRDRHVEQKMGRAADLGELCKWPGLMFIILGSERARNKDIPLLTWQRVAEILRHLHGNDDPTAAFIDQQVALAGEPPVDPSLADRRKGIKVEEMPLPELPHENGRHMPGITGGGNNSVTGVWLGHGRDDLRRRLLEEARALGLQPRRVSQFEYDDLDNSSGQVVAQIHAHSQRTDGLVLVRARKDCEGLVRSLERCPLGDRELSGDRGQNLNWLRGNKPYHGKGPAEIYWVPVHMATQPEDHPGWEDVRQVFRPATW